MGQDEPMGNTPNKDVKFNGYISEFDTGFFEGLFRSTGGLTLVSMENTYKQPGLIMA